MRDVLHPKQDLEIGLGQDRPPSGNLRIKLLKKKGTTGHVFRPDLRQQQTDGFLGRLLRLLRD